MKIECEMRENTLWWEEEIFLFKEEGAMKETENKNVMKFYGEFLSEVFGCSWKENICEIFLFM